VNVALDDTDVPARPSDGDAPNSPSSARRLPPVAWGDVVRWALVGTLLLAVLVLVDVHRHGGNNPVSLIQPGTRGSATELFEQDFPELEQPRADGLDGQIYYAIARNPFHLDETAQYMDHPRYRYQRPLLPVTAWLIHPTGGGMPLVGAIVLVSLISVIVFAVAGGGLSMTLRGPPWVAALIPLLPGAYWSLRVTVSDAMALGLALLAILLAARSRHGWAIFVGCLAVWAKEPVILVLLGWSISRRTKKDAMLTVGPALAILAWMGWLHLQFPPDAPRSQDIGPPVVGVVKAWTKMWSQGDELVGMACTLGGFAIGIVALAKRGLRHPLGWAIAIQLGFLSFMGFNPLGTNFGGTRMAMPIMALSLIALVTPRGAAALDGTEDPDADELPAPTGPVTAPA
jgi:hypothetical protein